MTIPRISLALLFKKKLFTSRFNTCLWFFFALPSGFFSQAFYSVNPDYLQSKKESNNLLTEYRSDYPDSSVSSMHLFFQRNYLGNYGLASPDYVLDFKNEDLGFRLYPSPLQNDMFLEKNVLYMRSKGPFANITGIAGTKQLQVLKMLFTHTYKDKVNITLQFNRYATKGFYNRQQTYTNNFYISSNAITFKKRAGYYFFYLNNGNKNQENGGLLNDTLTPEQVLKPKELQKVKMNSAVRDHKEHRVMLNPWLKISNNKDSLGEWNLFLQTKSRFSFQYWIHKDNASRSEGNYLLFYNDTVKTYDSTALVKFTNDVMLSAVKGYGAKGISLGYRNETSRLHQKNDSVFMNNLIVADAHGGGKFGKEDSLGKSNLIWNAAGNFQYIFSGPNANDYLGVAKTSLRPQINNGNELFVMYSLCRRSADFIYNNWSSNHFNWSGNGFLPTQTQQLKLGAMFKKNAGLSLIAQQINNLLYFDDMAYPGQYKNSIQNYAITAHFNFVLLKHLGLYGEQTFQQTSHPTYLSIPPTISTARIFYAGNLFHGNLQLNLGFQAQVYGSFYSYSYMPASQVFYLQHQRQTSQYPYLDFYLNARIRPVSAFIKVENVLQNYTGSNYSLVKGYYQPDRCVRFGIAWMFFD